MPTGLQVSRLVNVQVNIAPLAAQFANFNSLLIVGSSSVINVEERIREYNSLDEVAEDFGTSAPEYLAANIFFSQVPSPDQLFIGRWAESATPGLLICGVLSAAQQLMSAWTVITTGAFKIAINGGAGVDVTGCDFSAQTNLNGVASVITTRLTAASVAATCTWDGDQFVFTTTLTGATAAVAALTAPGSGTNISAQLKGTTGTLERIVEGIAAETALAAVTILDDNPLQWYGLMFADSSLVNSDYLAIAAYIEGLGQNTPHLFGICTSESAALSTGDTTSIGYQLKQLSYRRSFVQWSSSSPYAQAAIFGKGVTVDFDANFSVITFMWKQEVGVVAETLTATQATALDNNNYNYYANFNNNTMIVVNGKVANGDFIDNTWNLDWFANRIQTDVWNLLYTSPTKIPQTDAGNHLIKTTIEASCAAAVYNGTLAPGQWNSGGFGQLKQGDFLDKGFYVYMMPISQQAQADREARESVPFQVAAKLAGAIHTVDIIVNVNR